MTSDSGPVQQSDERSEEAASEAWRDASEVGTVAARRAWTLAARPILVEAARRYRALVLLKDLAPAVQEDTRIRTSQPTYQWIGDVLEGIAAECESRGEPLLTSLCVNVQRSVGEVYADIVEHVRGTGPSDPDEHAASERLDCYRHWEAAGLPSDGGTPLRTAHVKVTRKAAPRKATRAAAPARARKPSAAASPPAPAPKPVALCPRCFTQVPASGICDYCD